MISPAPLEAMFVDDPGLLANCHIGLNVDKVTREISGPASEYLVGRYRLEVQPAQSRIRLSPASVTYGKLTYQAAAELSTGHLTYHVED